MIVEASLDKLKILTLRWWLCSAPAQLCPRFEPLSFCRPPECFGWRIPPRWCSCSQGWTHFLWNGTAGYFSLLQSLRLVQLEAIQKLHLDFKRTALKELVFLIVSHRWICDQWLDFYFVFTLNLNRLIFSCRITDFTTEFTAMLKVLNCCFLSLAIRLRPFGNEAGRSCQ